jgi:hypothetical protein
MMIRHSVVGLIALGMTTAALAQSSLGELLDGGAKKLPKDTVKSTLSGAQVSGKSVTGASTEYVYKPDGSFTGNLQNSEGWKSGAVGRWTVDDDGKICSEWTLTVNSKRLKGCGFLFSKADEYYYVESDSDRSAPIFKRVIKK